MAGTLAETDTMLQGYFEVSHILRGFIGLKIINKVIVFLLVASCLFASLPATVFAGDDSSTNSVQAKILDQKIYINQVATSLRFKMVEGNWKLDYDILGNE